MRALLAVGSLAVMLLVPVDLQAQARRTALDDVRTLVRLSDPQISDQQLLAADERRSH